MTKLEKLYSFIDFLGRTGVFPCSRKAAGPAFLTGSRLLGDARQ